MTPARLNLTIRRGVTFGPIKITCKDGSGVAMNLTDWHAFAQVRKKPGQTVVLDLEPEITNPTAGEVTIGFTDEETASMTAGSFLWDFVLENPTGERLGPYLAGSCNISSIITQPA